MSDARLRLWLLFTFGFVLLAVITSLSLALALEHVEEATSVGLKELLACLMTLAGTWANAALRSDAQSAGPAQGATPPSPDVG